MAFNKIMTQFFRQLAKKESDEKLFQKLLIQIRLSFLDVLLMINLHTRTYHFTTHKSNFTIKFYVRKIRFLCRLKKIVENGFHAANEDVIEGSYRNFNVHLRHMNAKIFLRSQAGRFC